MSNCEKLSVELVEKIRSKKPMTIKEIKDIVCISDGNMKLGKGVYNWSTLPGDKNYLITKKDGTVLCLTGGTCGRNCGLCFKECYAVNSALRRPSCREAWERNTLMVRNYKDLCYRLISKFIDRKAATGHPVEMFRIHVSGEFESLDDIIAWNDLAKKYPSIKFYTYSKKYEFLAEFKMKGYTYEPNFAVNISEWHNRKFCEDLANYTGLSIFAYVDEPVADTYLNDPRFKFCPVVKRGGKENHSFHCHDCIFCKSNGRRTAVWAH